MISKVCFHNLRPGDKLVAPPYEYVVVVLGINDEVKVQWLDIFGREQFGMFDNYNGHHITEVIKLPP